jgi:hypothetical protein
MRFVPKGYVGIDHETRGSDILAVLAALRMPEETLGLDTFLRLEKVHEEAWYPASWLIEMTDEIERRVGRFALRQVGRKAFTRSQRAIVRKTVHCARDILYGMNEMYRRVNRGTGIGRWSVLEFAPGRASVEKTTPHHCVMVEGILLEALATIGVPAVIEQSACIREGADSCIFLISSSIDDARWSGDA